MPEKIFKILMAEDDTLLIKLYKVRLERRGFETASLLDGTEVLSKAKSENPDLIMLDVSMPKKDGFEVLKELKADPQTKHIPVFMLTKLGQDSDRQKGLDLGATKYLSKVDINIEDTMAEIERYLKGMGTNGA